MNFFPKKSRWGYVLAHAATAGVISLVLELFGASYLSGILAALLALVMKEYGEIVGKSKAAGTFENNFKGNKAAFIDAVDDKWQLWQTAGAVAVFVVARLVLKIVFGL